MVVGGHEMTTVELNLAECNLILKGRILDEELFENEIGETLILFNASINGVQVGELNCNPDITVKLLKVARGIVYTQAYNYRTLIRGSKKSIL